MNESFGRVARNSMAIYLGRIFNLLISFFIFIHLANYLGEHVYGRLSVGIAYIAIFDILSNFGLNQILVRELSNKRYGSDKILGIGITLKIVLSLLAVLLAGFMAFILNYSGEVLFIIGIISINLIISSKLSSLRSVFETVYQAELRMKVPILFSVVDSILFALLIYIFTVRYQTTLVGIAIIYSISNLPGTIFLLITFVRSNRVKFAWDWVFMKRIILECFPLFLFILFSILSTRIDILLLSWMRGDGEVGYYSAATRLVYPLMFLSTSLSMSLYPMLSRHFDDDRELLLKTFKIGMKFIFLLGVFLGVTLGFNAKKIIMFLYVDGYRSVAPAFRVLSITPGFNFLNFYFVDLFVAAKQQRLTTLVMAAGLSLNVCFNLIVIPRHGFVGASYVRLLTAVVCFTFFYLLIVFKLKISDVLDYGKLVPLVLLFGSANYFFIHVHLVWSLLFSISAFMGLVLILRVIKVEEIKLLKDALIIKNFGKFKY